MPVDTVVQSELGAHEVVNTHVRRHGFPRRFLSLVRCTSDGGALAITNGSDGDAELVWSGSARCATCAAEYAIRDGVLVLLQEEALDELSADEQRKRNAERKTYIPADTAAAKAKIAMEMAPVLEEVRAAPGRTILEVGCGEGRYTLELAQTSDVVAMDFSIELLRMLQQRLPGNDERRARPR